ncbi:LysM peptidoglycan-binding domain-containing protein [Mesorhizobium sp. VK23B]|uniref:LysM peptidoglycan-binding domain-containing protein n=1 Tax=Mesorhizobium dulcispinae TaxID=3072316 RepID=A0ABU4XLF4_9HYPH|nr:MULTISPECIES: LysM peptidoglycan-binding domain-containing protein [unclassified Mesorhizobium]MDX8469303.1 LysM peptidoglycan-binding domain-containing protein [Mesorhizobium sp. VK23B]MDX8475564.1 LysM peptidoglycan-binding domain-containing protein [Mesorhizobium sp. VK23A]
MAINPSKAFLFAAGGVAVVAAVAYGSGALDPYINKEKPAQVAALPQADTKPAESSSTSTEGRLPQAQAPANTMAPANNTMAPANKMAPANNATAPAASAPAAQAPAAGPILPTFDVVRVEGNGSIVVAGGAAPSAKVEVLNGATVLGSTDAGPDGAFAIVLDDPLKPGDYTITLRATAGGVAVASAQTAVVSVPQSPTGQVLAMVEEPGKPSELLTVPQPEAKPAAPAADKAAAPVAQTPAAPAAPATATAPTAAAPAATGQTAGATTPAPAAPAAAEPKIAVEAVEIDGSKIFVAGTADSGRKVRAYADDLLLGEAKTSPDGHFLIEAARDIPVGNHTIHVDGLDDDGVKVVARAAVPFEREPGESIAAVAPSETKPAGKKLTQVQGAGSQSAEAKSAEAQSAEAKSTAAAETTPAESTAPAAEAPAKVAEATPSAGVAETVAPKLEHADGSVIIRRNDTLWRISRRVYGHGTRFSTIYLANQDQIRDPDRIWPGQVFKVPGKSKEGEPADMKAMGDQMTTPKAE